MGSIPDLTADAVKNEPYFLPEETAEGKAAEAAPFFFRDENRATTTGNDKAPAPLYNSEEIVRGNHTVVITASERDADIVNQWYTGTAAPYSWAPSHTEVLKQGDRTTIFGVASDQDEEGLKRLDAIGAALRAGGLKLFVVTLPEHKSSVSEWADADGTVEGFGKLIKAGRFWSKDNPCWKGGNARLQTADAESPEPEASQPKPVETEPSERPPKQERHSSLASASGGQELSKQGNPIILRETDFGKAPVAVPTVACSENENHSLGNEKNRQVSNQAILYDDELAEDECVFLSQDFLAADFTKQFGPSWRYVSAQGKWRQWDGMKWKADEKCEVLTKARLICRTHAPRAETKAAQRTISSAPTVAAVVKLAGADPKHAATIDQWDANPMLLNTPAGIVNLATGKMFPHHPDLYMTRACSVAPRDMPTPEWDKFLEWAQPDPEVRAYLDRRSGYGLTGNVSAQVFFMDYGHGGNGKGVYKTVLLEIMSDYATSAPIELLTETQNDQHPTELARLHGARIVSISETQSGRRWNENRIKMMTGGDRITARFMRQDFFEYDPQFKLFILGNHMPTLRNVDDAMKRRLQVVQWAQKISPDMRDDNLIEKLRPEYPGILYRLIQGCLDWQQGGLNPPSVVTDHTEEYFTGEDKLGQWLSEWDTKDATAYSSKSELFMHWFDWCTKQGEIPGTKNKLTKILKDRGFKDDKHKDAHGFWGIKPATCTPQCNCHH